MVEYAAYRSSFAGNVPVTEVLVKGSVELKHGLESRHIGDVPIPDVLIKGSVLE